MKHNRLPPTWTTVTPLSKYLAMAIFIILPFISFYLGTEYQRMITPEYPPTQYIAAPPVKQQIKPKQTGELMCGGIDNRKCPSGYTCELHAAEMYSAGTCVVSDPNVVSTEGLSGTIAPSIVPTTSASPTDQTFCAQDTRQCSDGSFVSRTGPNCTFAACPQ